MQIEFSTAHLNSMERQFFIKFFRQKSVGVSKPAWYIMIYHNILWMYVNISYMISVAGVTMWQSCIASPSGSGVSCGRPAADGSQFESRVTPRRPFQQEFRSFLLGMSQNYWIAMDCHQMVYTKSYQILLVTNFDPYPWQFSSIFLLVLAPSCVRPKSGCHDVQCLS